MIVLSDASFTSTVASRYFLSGPLNWNDLLQASFVDIDTISLKNKQIICLTCIDNQILQ